MVLPSKFFLLFMQYMTAAYLACAVASDHVGGHRSLAFVSGGQTCVVCSQFTNNNPNNCYSSHTGGCLSVSCSRADFSAGTQVVTVDFRACKTGAFGWACCRSSSCSLSWCGSSGTRSTQNPYTCMNAAAVSYTIPLSMTLLPLQVRRW